MFKEMINNLLKTKIIGFIFNSKCTVSHGLFSHADVQMTQHTDRKGSGDDDVFQALDNANRNR